MDSSGDPRSRDRFRGCLLGGAVGDAIGAPIEFMSIRTIRRHFGPDGVTGFVGDAWPAGSITDDTQMSLWTAEGLIRAQGRGATKGVVDIPTMVRHAYLRWFETQDPSTLRRAASGDPVLSGWLLTEPVLHARRAPGNTCLGALRDERFGTIAEPLNDSKGCGSVMRAAPVGLASDDPFELSCRIGALTHGHPSGYLSAGAFAVVIAELRRDAGLDAGIEAARRALQPYAASGWEVLAALDAVARLVDEVRPDDPSTAADAVERLGAGWVADEALAIALYCASVAASPMEAILMAANHSGDSDSTAAVCGNLVGVQHGTGWIPDEVLSGLEARALIERVADDLHDVFVLGGAVDLDRYPPT